MKILQPDRAKDQLENPNGKDYKIQFVSLQFAKHSKTNTGKDHHTDQRVHNVVGQRHFTHSRQTFFRSEEHTSELQSPC